jgi:diguanylate cyclase (GGDEF)-like protein
MTVATTGSLPDTLAHVAQVTTSALSCDLGVVATSDGQFAVAGALGPDALGPESIAELHAELLSMTAPRCVQDAAVVAPPEPLASLGGVRAWFAIPIPDPAGGWLLLCHTNARPRGFTDLCQRLGVQLAEAAAILVHVASLRDGLVRELERETGHARRDPLTEVLNRRGWQDALEEMGYRCRDSVISIMTVDVDGLKQINDSEGHQAGDTLLCMVAETLLDNVRVGDIVARIGGDEFAVLLPDTDEATVQTVADRVREKSIAMSVGVATCLGTGDLDAAIHLADQRMYAEKRRNRPSVGVPVQPGQETQVARSA